LARKRRSLDILSKKDARLFARALVILEMILSEPQCSCVVVTFREINSKDEQGNDNIIACDSNGSSTATENYSTMSVTI